MSPTLPPEPNPPSAGEQRRRQVMGDSFVDRALAGVNAFTQPLQDHTSDHAWGSTWLREGLALKQRSLCTVAMLAALGHTHELKGHLRGAINNGATLVELREVLLHVAPYAGVPASGAAFRAASEWLAAEGLGFDDAPSE
ncbi:MAG: carboxymuconolactone decarboxylase family protein [Rhizobacter sp.]|nr:carboxymuconolactone decarboxylase family protein [Rhizobacter sp.]